MTCYGAYSSEALRTERLLKSHGFDRWPTEEEIALYLFEANDRIDAICSFAGLQTSKDIRGRWIVQSSERKANG